ncbi:hypothetical protein VPH35_071634 [Triticum aestivum]
MEELMKEAHALFCGGWSTKESQVFISTLQHLLTAATKIKTDDPDAAKKTRVCKPPLRISSDGHGNHRFQIRSIAAIDGKFYFDVTSSKLGVLDFLPGPAFTMMETNGAKVAWDSWELAFPHLVESRGGLYLFVITHNALAGIALYQMDFSSLAWSKVVDRVYDRVFFLGRLHSAASYAAWELGLTQGNVYYLGPIDLAPTAYTGAICRLRCRAYTMCLLELVVVSSSAVARRNEEKNNVVYLQSFRYMFVLI